MAEFMEERSHLVQREQGGRVPAVALTAYARREDREQAIAAGFDLHLAKPVEPAELAWALVSLLRK